MTAKVTAWALPAADTAVVRTTFTPLRATNHQLVGRFTEPLTAVTLRALTIILAGDFWLISAAKPIVAVDEHIALGSGEFGEQIVVGSEEAQSLSRAVTAQALVESSGRVSFDGESTAGAMATATAVEDTQLVQATNRTALGDACGRTAVICLVVAVVT